MSKKWLIGAGLFAAASVFAQYGYESQESSDSFSEAPAEESVAPAAPVYAPAPVVAPVAAPEPAPQAVGKVNFDMVRGNAYNPFGNEAAASNVSGYYGKPHSVHGNRMVYLEPVNETGFASFGGTSSTFFLGLDNSDDLGQLMLGMGTKDFGFMLAAALGQYSQTVKASNEVTTSVTEQGDYLGAVFSMPLGAMEMAVAAEWYTFADQTSVDGATDLDASNYDLNLYATLGNGPSAKDLFWTAELAITRHNESQEVANNTIISPLNHFEVAPGVNMGTKILGNDRARVFLGLAAALPIRFYDDIKNSRESAMEMALLVAPNILAELGITENWLMFGGAGQSLDVFSYGGYTTIAGATKTEYSALQSKSNSSQVNMGLRYQKDNYAFEAALSDNLFRNGTSEIFNGTNVMATFGGFIYF